MTFSDLLACGGIGATTAGAVVLAIAIWARASGYSHVGLISAETKANDAHPYRAAAAASGQESTVDPREAWDAGAAAERRRVLTIVCAVREASKDSDVHRAADAIRDGVKAGPV